MLRHISKATIVGLCVSLKPSGEILERASIGHLQPRAYFFRWNYCYPVQSVESKSPCLHRLAALISFFIWCSQ